MRYGRPCVCLNVGVLQARVEDRGPMLQACLPPVASQCLSCLRDAREPGDLDLRWCC